MKNLFVITLLFFTISTSAHAKTVQPIAVQELLKSIKMWNGDQLPSYPATQPEITILKYVIQPGTKLPLHKHPVINAGVLIKGELVVHSKKGPSKKLKTGEALVELVNQWHYGSNEGTEPAEIIVFYAGSPGSLLTVKEK